MLISKKMFKMREHKAATIIQKFWRGAKCREWCKIRKRKMHAAASKLQSAWRLYWFLQIGPRIRKARFARSATMIQKYMKGYITKKKIYKNLMEAKVNNCFDFFTKMRLEREKNARMIIRYWTLKYFLKKKAANLAAIAKKKAAALKKAEDDKKKKGKYGYVKPKKTVAKPKPIEKKSVLDKTPTSKIDSSNFNETNTGTELN